MFLIYPWGQVQMSYAYNYYGWSQAPKLRYYLMKEDYSPIPHIAFTSHRLILTITIDHHFLAYVFVCFQSVTCALKFLLEKHSHKLISESMGWPKCYFWVATLFSVWSLAQCGQETLGRGITYRTCYNNEIWVVSINWSHTLSHPELHFRTSIYHHSLCGLTKWFWALCLFVLVSKSRDAIVISMH